MSDLLIAASPVEIEARTEELGLPQAAHDAAAQLFHDLTSQLELQSLRISRDAGESRPTHRFFFGSTEGAITELIRRIRADTAYADVTATEQDGPVGSNALFIAGSRGGYEAVLVAAHDAALLDKLTGPLAAG